MKITKYNIFDIVLDMILIIAISLLFYLSKDIQTSKIVYIPNGSINKIISYLEARNFEVSKIDSYLIRFFGKPQSGWINIGKTKISKADFLYKLTHSKAPLVSIELIPGETKEIFFEELSKKLNLNQTKLEKYYNALTNIKDGVILPNTYEVPMGISERHLITYLVKSSLHQHKILSNKIFGTFNKKKWFKYIVIASIIQKEAASKKEMPIISSVIHNRLKKGMKLQMDGSLKYGYYSHQQITPKRIKEDDSEYNTYKIKGLPKDPVCSVSLDAIKAAIFPAKDNYLYFVKGKKGKQLFSNNYKKHLYNIRMLQKETIK